MRALVFWAIIIFVAGFLHGRQMQFVSTASDFGQNQQQMAATAPPVPATNAAPASPIAPATTRARVTVRMLKFSPEKLEVKVGDDVEWANADLTPHTATSQTGGALNSGAINAGASWHHTFTQAGSFPYFCTFHPEMKGVVVVK